MSRKANRRQFIAATTSAGAGLAMAGAVGKAAEKTASAKGSQLAKDGGEKAVKAKCSAKPRWGEVEQEQLGEMLQQGSLFYWNGPQTKLLLERFREVCPVKYAQNCSSGTAAIHIAVAAAGIGLGDEVITSPVTDIGTVIGILYQQAVPVFADLGLGTYNLDVADVERRITPKTKGIIAVHLTGNPCDMDALMALCKKHNLVLIEDCCQAWGAKYRGRPIGTVGHFGCFSLQNSKHVTCGDGGIVGTNDERFGPLLQPFGDKGASRTGKREFPMFATNYRMSEPQAAVAAAQLTRLEEIASKRAKLGKILTENISGLPGIIPHEVHPEDRHVCWFYMFRIVPEAFKCNRSVFTRALLAEGARVSGGYIKVPLYGEEVFQKHAFFAGRWPVKDMGLTDMDFTKHKCPNAESMLTDGIRVYVYEYMTEDYILGVAKAIQKVARHYAV
jgi:dTDP-4-amino-4,6-dideoxygalactose transaminase